jgi:pSer/pThr/pTyr-binding forkhead associated (FHA) protein
MNVQLVVQNGNRGTRVVTLQCEETVVGRRQDCDLRIPSNDVSRRHCLLSMHDGCLNVEDLDSVNGTFVNGERTSGRRLVLPGDKLQIGPVLFVARYEMSAATRARLEQEGGSAAAQAGGNAPEQEEEEVDVLPLADDEDSHKPTRQMERPALAEPDEEEPLELAEFLDDAEWSSPSGGDLRDLLSQLDESKPSKTEEE